MNLLFVIHSPKNANTAVYNGYLNKKAVFEKNGWEVDILSPEDFAFSSRAGRFLPLVYPFQVARWLYTTRVPFDLVVFHSYCGWVFHLVKKIINRKSRPFKTATTFHGVEGLFFRAMAEEGKHSAKPISLRFRIFYCFLMVRMIWLSCRNSDKVFCLNNHEKKYLEKNNYQQPGKINVLPNEIHGSFFAPHTYKPKAEILLFVGQWLPMKGTTYLIRAFEKLAPMYPGLQLHLVGTLKKTEDVLKDFPLSLHARIKVIPEVPHSQISDYYRSADIFILPSLYEAFNRSLTEAMASALPAITTPVGIVDDSFKPEVDHLQIPFRDADAIVRAVSSLIDEPKRRENLGTAGQKAVRRYEQDTALNLCFKGYYDLMMEPFA